MESKFTPGPWSLIMISGALRHINRNVEDEMFTDTDSVEYKMYKNGEIGFPNVRINPLDAHLIAAAPDMYNALIEALKHHQGGHSEIGNIIKSALTKANGGLDV